MKEKDLLVDTNRHLRGTCNLIQANALSSAHIARDATLISAALFDTFMTGTYALSLFGHALAPLSSLVH